LAKGILLFIIIIKTKQNKTKQNKTKQNKTKQNKTDILFSLPGSYSSHLELLFKGFRKIKKGLSSYLSVTPISFLLKKINLPY
jgi:lipid A disaccharide synthetase